MLIEERTRKQQHFVRCFEVFYACITKQFEIKIETNISSYTFIQQSFVNETIVFGPGFGR